jgi:EAL domain-containing protein (putative c-di-GMP-specific phosphodiesterase class I)
LVPPGEFIALAEEVGLIVPIGSWVLRQACLEAARWPAELSVAVNLSPVQFKSKGLVEKVKQVLSETGLEPMRLILEITETVVMQDSEATLVMLHQLRALGVKIAMDDFGTGYSSLSYLRYFPIDVLKIDQSFVHQITADPDDSTIVSAIISMGKSLKHIVVAEGVETHEQRVYLHHQGCAEGQGYLFSRPLAADQFAHLLQTGLSTLVH